MNKLYKELITSNIEKALKDFKASGNYHHSVLKGRAREIFITNLLKPFLQPEIGICTGVVIDSLNNHSKQIDIIIYNKAVVPSFLLNENEGVIPIEAVLATIEVKSVLKVNKNDDKKDTLKQGIANARSIKVLQEMGISKIRQNSALCCLVALESEIAKGQEFDRLKKYVKEFNETEEYVKVPVSDFLIIGNSFHQCVDAKDRKDEEPVFESIMAVPKQNNEIVEFIISLMNTCNLFSKQRDYLNVPLECYLR